MFADDDESANAISPKILHFAEEVLTLKGTTGALHAHTATLDLELDIVWDGQRPGRVKELHSCSC